MKQILRTTANNSNRYEPMNSTRQGNCCPLVVATLVPSSRTITRTISRLTLRCSAEVNSSFSRDRGPHELFCTSLCACRCLGASDPGPGRGRGPSHGHARPVRADRSSSQRSSGLLGSVERPRLRQHTADITCQKVSSVRTICVLFRDEIQYGEDRMTVGAERSSKNRFFS